MTDRVLIFLAMIRAEQKFKRALVNVRDSRGTRQHPRAAMNAMDALLDLHAATYFFLKGE